jgi:hypothetical protein
MDQKLSDALAFANYRLTLQAQRQNIQARTEAALLVSYQNAIFRSDIALISFVDTHQKISTNTLYVKDQSGNAILIENPAEFVTVLVQAYDAAMQLEYQEQQKLKQARNTAKIVGL